jgi:hypothetical protein
MGHRRYVDRGDLCAGAAGGSRRWQEPAAGSPGVWAGTEDGKQDAGVFVAARIPGAEPVRRPGLAAWQGVMDAILEEDKQRPKKQRHTAKRIFERLSKHAGREYIQVLRLMETTRWQK